MSTEEKQERRSRNRRPRKPRENKPKTEWRGLTKEHVAQGVYEGIKRALQDEEVIGRLAILSMLDGEPSIEDAIRRASKVIDEMRRAEPRPPPKLRVEEEDVSS